MKLSKKAADIAPSLTLKIDALLKQMRAEGQDVIGFGAGEPDFDTPEYIKNAAREALDRGLTKYTLASGMPELKQAVCDRYARKYGLQYTPEQVVISNGAKHSLYNAFQALLDPGDEVIIIAPYWLSYPEMVKMAGGVPVYVTGLEENDFQAKAEDIEAAVTGRTAAIVVTSPSNPCGCVYSQEEMRAIAAIAQAHDFAIIADEIYDELVYTEGASSIACVSADAQARTIVINGMSKTFAMTGWRIGYAIAPANITKAIGSYQSQSTSNPCSIAQYASIAALNNGEKELTEMQRVFRHRSELMYALVNDIHGISCRKPEGAFYAFVNISRLIGRKYRGEVIDGSVKLAELLLKEKLTAVVPGAAFGADGFVRLSYATSEENIRRGLARIAQFVGELED